MSSTWHFLCEISFLLFVLCDEAGKHIAASISHEMVKWGRDAQSSSSKHYWPRARVTTLPHALHALARMGRNYWNTCRMYVACKLRPVRRSLPWSGSIRCSRLHSYLISLFVLCARRTQDQTRHNFCFCFVLFFVVCCLLARFLDGANFYRLARETSELSQKSVEVWLMDSV